MRRPCRSKRRCNIYLQNRLRGGRERILRSHNIISYDIKYFLIPLILRYKITTNLMYQSQGPGFAAGPGCATTGTFAPFGTTKVRFTAVRANGRGPLPSGRAPRTNRPNISACVLEPRSCYHRHAKLGFADQIELPELSFPN